MMNAEKKGSMSITRRDLLKAGGAIGAGLAMAPVILGEAAKAASKDLNIAFIGVGTQGRVLLTNALKIPNLRFVAVCDIWPYNQGYAVRLLKKYQHMANPYVDYQEMLAKEKDLDAVLIASPDWVHAEHAIACMKAGKHVYSEKEMSNDVSLAKQMVKTSQETKKLLQVGHQRRSNPRYQLAYDFFRAKKACGLPVFVSAHWNRPKRLDAAWPQGQELDEATLKKFGYDTMERFRNWRRYKKFSGGLLADIGSHQIDIFNWFLKSSPKTVMASGGLDFYEGQDWFDNVDAIFEWDYDWEGKKRVIRGFYQTLTSSSHGGYAETFIGSEGSIIISEMATTGGIRREQEAPEADWEKAMPKPKIGAEAPAATPAAAPAAAPAAGTAAAPAAKTAEAKADEEIKVGHSVPQPGRYYPPINTVPPFDKSEHLPHIENFIAAIRDGVPLNCPGEVGYDTAVTVLKANDAVAQAKRLEYTPDEFKA